MGSEIPSPAEALAATRTRQIPRHPRPVWVCRLREERQRLGLRMREVVAAVGISLATISRLEYGEDPQLTTARKLAAFYGRTVEELWPGRRGR